MLPADPCIELGLSFQSRYARRHILERRMVSDVLFNGLLKSETQQERRPGQQEASSAPDKVYGSTRGRLFKFETHVMFAQLHRLQG